MLACRCFGRLCCLHLHGEFTGDPSPSQFITNIQSVTH